MPELKSCYFCGDIGDALTAVDVVPADLADESTQRTVVVCSTCQRKLDAVLAPLRSLAVAGEASGSDVDASTADVDDGPTTDDSTPSDVDDGPTTDDRVVTGDSTPTDEDATGTADSQNDATGAIDAESPLAPTDRVEASTDDTESGGITFADTAESPDDATVERGDGVEFHDGDPDGFGTDDPDGAENEDVPDGDDSAEEPTTTGDETAVDASAADTPSDDPPTGYRKVVRLLQNREFPVEGASFVDLASNAYELEESAVSASLDRLVERGALVESGGKLQKP